MLNIVLLAAVCTLQFDAPRAYEAPPASQVARDAEVADLDGDGFPDVVVDDAFAYLRYGRRGGGLGERIALPVSEATPLDVDRDRLPDLIVRYETTAGPRIGVMRNLGNRTFAPPREVFAGSGTMVTGDFTNDGAPDVLLVRAAGEPAFLLNDGRGNFEVKWGGAPALTDVRKIVTGDFNGDGNLDLAAWHRPSVVLQFLHGDGTGYLPPGPELESRMPLAAADFDGDGTDELLTTGRREKTVTVWRGTTAADVEVSAGAFNAFAAIGDFNGDGATDVALAIDDYRVHVLLNDGHGTLTERGSFRTPTSGIAFAAGDFDSDGDDDLLVSSGYGIGIVPSNGDGTFRLLPRVPAVTGQPADVDGDGVDERIDVVHGQLVIVRAGSVAERVSVRTASAWSIVAWHAASRRVLALRDGVMELFVRDPNGEWRLERTHDVDPASAALGDFDGDGVPEIAYVPRGTASRLLVLEPSGSTRFEAPIGTPWVSLTAADMNGDGRDDLAVTYAGSAPTIPHAFEPNPDGWIDVHLSAGTSFLPPARVVEKRALVAPQRGDFDGDGKDDLAVATYATDMLVVWGRTMTATVVIDEVEDWYAMELAVGDLNDDGFDDLVATHVELDLHILTGSAAGLVKQGPFMQPAWYTRPVIARLEAGKPRAIVLRDLTDEAAGDFLLQPTCAYPRRRGVRN